MRTISIFAISLITWSLNAHSQANPPSFDNEKYIKECGGKVYSKCDKDNLTQATIYAEAKKMAQASKRLLLINVGADWCPPCIIMNEVIKAGGEDLRKINEKFVLVKMNGGTESYKTMQRSSQWPGVGYPTMIVVDPDTDRAITSFYPTEVKTVAGIRAELAKRLAQAAGKTQQPTVYKWYPNTKEKDESGLNIRLALLLRPIALDTKTQVLAPKVTLPNGAKRDQALAYYNQGLFYLFGFHWVDAARSLRSAILLEPNFYAAYLALTMALDELYIFHGDDEAVNPLMVARQISEKIKVSESEKSFAKYLETKLCVNNARTCKQFGIVLVSEGYEVEDKAAQEVIETARSEKNADIMALAGRSKADTLDEVIKMEPNHLGAHHYLIHQNEGTNEYKKAAQHAAKFVELAPQLAHSHHMYGHILPKIGKWKEAVTRFIKADEIHKAWFSSNQAHPWEDWHYEHNLNLLAHAYFFGGEMAKAEEYWKRRCEDLKRLPCEEYFQFLILVGRGAEADKLIKSYWLDPMTAKGGYDAKAAEIMSDELISLSALMRARNVQEANTVLTRLRQNPKAGKEDNKFLQQLNTVVNFKQSKAEIDGLTQIIQDELSGGGFDSWSESIFKTEFLFRLATKLGFKNLASSIQVSKLAVGFRCK